MYRAKATAAAWIAVVLVAAILMSLRPGSAQDQTEQRLAGLEARVTALETQVAALTSSSDSDQVPAEHTVSGTLVVEQPFKSSNPPLRDPVEYDPTEQSCANSGTRREFHTGAKVVASDESGDTIGTSILELRPGFVPEGSTTATCEYVFTIDLPAFEFVTFTIGGVDSPTYSVEELEAQGWEVGLSL